MLSVANVWKNILLYQRLWEHQKSGTITQVLTLVTTSTQKPLLIDYFCSFQNIESFILNYPMIIYSSLQNSKNSKKNKLGKDIIIFLLLLLLKEP